MSLILKNRFFIIIIISVFCLKIEAQFLDKNYYLVDSLIKTKNNSKDFLIIEENVKKYKLSSVDTTRLNILSVVVENVNDETIWPKYNSLMYKSANEYLNKESNQFIKNRIKSKIALAINNFGYYDQNFNGNKTQALKLFKEASKIQEEIKDYPNLIVSKNNIANLLYNQGKIVEAIAIYNDAIKINKQLKNTIGLTAVYNNLAETYIFVGDSTNALIYLNKALSSAMQSKNKVIIAQELQNIGVFSIKRGHKNFAYNTLKKALALREEMGDVIGICKSKLNLAALYLSDKKYNICFQYLKDVEPLANNSNNLHLKHLFHLSFGLYYLSMGDKKLELYHYEKSMDYLKNNNFLQDELKVLDHLLKIYEQQNNSKKALELYRRKQELSKILNNIEIKKTVIKAQYETEFKQKEAELKLDQKLKEEKNKIEKHKQQLVLIAVLVVLIAVLIFSFFIFRALKLNKQKNKIISQQKIEVEKQKHLIEEKHKDITDSITYAHRIQSSLIPPQSQINKTFKNISIFFQPRNIVSGDFYWFSQQHSNTIFSLADCTGHGVPGAFMSIIGINQLNTLINEKGLKQPALILNELKNGIINSLNADAESNKKDGMDVALISFNQTELTFAGANQSVYILRNKELIELKGNKQPIGLSDNIQDFTEIKFDLLKSDRIVLYSDGLVDQFGGKEGKKLKSKNLKIWLTESADLELEQQKNLIATKLNTFKENFEQTDDITLAIIEI